MVVSAAGAVDMIVVSLERGFQFLTSHFAVADLGLVEQEVDDLVLIERSAKLRGGERILLDIFDETLTVLGAILLCRLHDEALHFLRADLHAMRLADLGEEQAQADARSEEHTSELQSLMRISYAVFCLKK